ncbi:MAG: nucleoside deaminase [Mariprofundales bacterium]|nr:nucleoside deaminase [Mariprofundales bacterium]
MVLPIRRIILELPAWVGDWVVAHPLPQAATDRLSVDQTRMRWVIDLAQEQVARGSGGPFAAAIVDGNSGALVSVGVNVVEASHCALAHAEMVAMGLAQQGEDSFNLAASAHPNCMLYSSSEPCAMCYGALPWSGVGRLVCGAAAADAIAIGFDEGEKPADWIDALAQRGIAVTTDCCREQAVAMLQRYASSQGVIYNGGRYGSS